MFWYNFLYFLVWTLRWHDRRQNPFKLVLIDTTKKNSTKKRVGRFVLFACFCQCAKNNRSSGTIRLFDLFIYWRYRQMNRTMISTLRVYISYFPGDVNRFRFRSPLATLRQMKREIFSKTKKTRKRKMENLWKNRYRI